MFTLSTVFLVLFSPPLIFLPCPLCSPSLSMWASVYLSVCVSSPLMFLACQCNGASAVNRACCSWIALCMPVLLDRQVQLACMVHVCFCWSSSIRVRLGMCVCTRGLHSFTWMHGDYLKEGEKVKGLACCCSFCRIFITLRGQILIIHGYMAPQTSQCFTGGEKEQHCKMTRSEIEKVLSLAVCVRLSICLLPQPTIHLLLIIYSPIDLFTHSYTFQASLCVLIIVAHL